MQTSEHVVSEHNYAGLCHFIINPVFVKTQKVFHMQRCLFTYSINNYRQTKKQIPLVGYVVLNDISISTWNVSTYFKGNQQRLGQVCASALMEDKLCIEI